MNLVKLKFLRDGKPRGREYTYISKSKVDVGDIVAVRKPDKEGVEIPKGIITKVNVPEKEVESFKDRLKEIAGKIELRCEECENLAACGEGDYVCLEGDKKVPIIDYRPTEDYLWCKGTKYKG